MQVVVLAGGFGTRLRPWTYEIPKPILPMLDKTLLEHVVEVVPENMVDEVVVAGGYKVDDIEEYFKQADVPYDVTIVKEMEPLGTGGALGNCRDVISGQFVCLNGDIISSLDMQVGMDLHKENGGIGTLALQPISPCRSETFHGLHPVTSAPKRCSLTACRSPSKRRLTLRFALH